MVNDVGAALDGSGSDAGPAQEVVDEIKKAGGQAIASTLSISEPANADKIVQAALDAFGRVDILVNNAGILRDKHLPPHELVGLVATSSTCICTARST